MQLSYGSRLNPSSHLNPRSAVTLSRPKSSEPEKSSEPSRLNPGSSDFRSHLNPESFEPVTPVFTDLLGSASEEEELVDEEELVL